MSGKPLLRRDAKVIHPLAEREAIFREA